MQDPLYRSGSSLNKTEKEELRDSILDLLGWGLSYEAMINLNYLNIKTLKEIYEAAKLTVSSPNST